MDRSPPTRPCTQQGHQRLAGRVGWAPSTRQTHGAPQRDAILPLSTALSTSVALPWCDPVEAPMGFGRGQGCGTELAWNPGKGAEGARCGPPKPHGHPKHIAALSYAPQAPHSTATPNPACPPRTPRTPPRTAGIPQAAGTHPARRGRPAQRGHPAGIGPPTRRCAGLPHRAASPLTCRCVAMETGEMLMSPWQGEPPNFGRMGDTGTGGGAGGCWSRSPRPRPAAVSAAERVIGTAACYRRR